MRAGLVLGLLGWGGVALAHPGHEGAAKPRSLYQDEVSQGFRAWLSSDVGLHLSLNGGKSWRWVCEDLFGGDVRSFALAGEDQGDVRQRVWLVGSFGRDLETRAPLPGLYLSTDGGCSWDQPQGALRGRWVSALSVSPQAPNEVLAGSADLTGDNGVALSTDAGRSWRWTSIKGVAGPLRSILRAPSDPKVVYAATRRRAWRSQDGGRTWAPTLQEQLKGTIDEVGLIAVDPEDPQALYFSHFGTRGRALWISRDGGRTGQELLLPSQLDFASATVLSGESGGRTLLVGTSQRSLYRSTDGGETWREDQVAVPLRYLAADRSQEGRAWVATRSRAVRNEATWQGHVIGALEGDALAPTFSYARTAGLLSCPEGSQLRQVCPDLDWVSVGRGDVVTKPRRAPASEAPASQEAPGQEAPGQEAPGKKEAPEEPSPWRWLWLLALLATVALAARRWVRREGR
jgi:photosystem II stability/assembly factor-like uncharacterized protein